MHNASLLVGLLKNIIATDLFFYRLLQCSKDLFHLLTFHSPVTVMEK